MPETTTTAARAAWQTMTDSNSRASHHLTWALAAGAGLFLVGAAPLAGAWTSGWRAIQGWFLRRQSGTGRHEVGTSSAAGEGISGLEGKMSKEAVKGSEECGDQRGAVTALVRPGLRPTAAASWFSANLRTLYNRLLLRPCPYSSYTYAQALVGTSHCGIVLLCLLVDSPPLRTNWRRAGCIAVVQVPWVFLFATKNTLLELVGMGYEKLNWLHRPAGRLVLFGGLLHTLLFFLNARMDWTRPMDVYGLVCAMASVILLVTSIVPVRRACYQVFLLSHVAGWITFVVALAFHVPEFARPYLIGALALYTLDVLARGLKTRLGAATLSALPGGMTRVESTTLSAGWRAGQHVWLRTWGGAGWSRSWETHPFTVARAPAEESCSGQRSRLTLLVKSTGRFTRGLLENSGPIYDYRQCVTVPCAIEGPYGGLRFLDLAELEAVVLVAGGSGITTCLPLVEKLLYLAKQGEATTRVVSLVWTVRTVEEIEWCREVLAELIGVARDETELTLRLSLHVTANPVLSPFKFSLPAPLASPLPDTSLSSTRPDLASILHAHAEGLQRRAERHGRARGGGLGVVVSGPVRLVRSARLAVARVPWSQSTVAGGIYFHGETLGW